ncbi:hypothetical protein [Deinococcus radiotolerans]|uniref:Uncharacterized protein n=1 Tax=Deinococcus radiotolerans TaxID=1309407 RepID=A0ABQ2FMS9_9DEIO|nr:hypothetical protein [Deinococcus radiotolerans]GGL07935.1 hypothetical protein GCM10010844_28320 [Deinococcus radiotolerans]
MTAHHPPVPWIISLLLALSSAAQAEGSVQLRLYSVPAPLDLRDSASVTLHYQTPRGSRDAITVDLSAERTAATFGIRYTQPRHTLQATGRRSADLAAARSDLGATLVYTYVPALPGSGAALTAVTTFYSLSSSASPTSAYSSHTLGVAGSARLTRELNLSTTATTTAVSLRQQASPLWSGAVSGALSYARDGTSAYLAPSLNLQKAGTRWNVTAGGSTRLQPNLTGTATVALTQGSPLSASGTLAYTTGRWHLQTTAATSTNRFTLGAGTRLTVSERLALGTSATYAPSTRTPTVAADVSAKAGGLSFGVTTSLALPPDTTPTFTAQANLSGQQQPWQGSLNLSYTRAPTTTSASATGTLSYTSGALNAQVGLGLNHSGPEKPITGRADLTVNYAVTPRLDLSASARYEQSAAATPATYRYGLGLRYRFDQETP